MIPLVLIVNMFLPSRLMALSFCLLLTGHGPAYASGETDTEVDLALEMLEDNRAEEATSRLVELAYSGSLLAQYNLGVIYLGRTDQAETRREGLFWLEKAAMGGDAGAAFDLAMVLYEEADRDANLDQAVRWLYQAARQGDNAARYNLGYLAHSNLEIDVSRSRGRELIARAAEEGDGRAVALEALLAGNTVSGAPAMYPARLKVRNSTAERLFKVRADQTPIFPYPAYRQTPLASLSAGDRVEVVKKQDGWLGVVPEAGYPAWVSLSEVTVDGQIATASGVEAGLYVEPIAPQETYKIGLVDPSVERAIIDQQGGWLKVRAPEHFLAWVQEVAVIRDVSETPYGGEAASVTQQVAQSGSGQLASNTAQGSSDQTVTQPARRVLRNWQPVYANADSSSRLLGIASDGDSVQVLEQGNGFERVRPGSGVQGWIYAKFLAVEGDQGRVTADNVRIRVLPSTGNSATIIGRVGRNQVYSIAGQSGDWYRIILDSRASGWIPARG